MQYKNVYSSFAIKDTYAISWVSVASTENNFGVMKMEFLA